MGLPLKSAVTWICERHLEERSLLPAWLYSMAVLAGMMGKPGPLGQAGEEG